MFDVGKIVRDTNSAVLGVAPNRATPETMRDIVSQLSSLTRELKLARLQKAAGVRDGVNVQTWSDDLDTWQRRLGQYEIAVSSARPGDRRAIQETVTAPLLLGWYLPGTPGIVNPEAQSVADLATPYILANQLSLSRAWYQERWGLLVKDLAQPVKQTVPWLLIAAGGGVAWYVMRKRGS